MTTIIDVSPVIAKPGDIIQISGENFNPVADMNQVSIGGVDARVITSNAAELNVVVPPVLTAGQYLIKLSTLHGIDLEWTRTVEVISPWKKLNDFPILGLDYATGLAVDGMGYVTCGETQGD
ncbi:MAG: IPT/TIG domain-containing protein [Bacteroidales bacterium]